MHKGQSLPCSLKDIVTSSIWITTSPLVYEKPKSKRLDSRHSNKHLKAQKRVSSSAGNSGDMSLGAGSVSLGGKARGTGGGQLSSSEPAAVPTFFVSGCPAASRIPPSPCPPSWFRNGRSYSMHARSEMTQMRLHLVISHFCAFQISRSSFVRSRISISTRQGLLFTPF
jgi:hypothetical protein